MGPTRPRPADSSEAALSVLVDVDGQANKDNCQRRSSPQQHQQQHRRPSPQQYDQKYSAMMVAIIQSRYISQRSASGSPSGVNNLPKGVINPFSARYNLWLGLTILAAAFTGWFEIYMMAFNDYPSLYPPKDTSTVLAFVMYVIFVVDMVLHFRVAILQGDRLITHPHEIARLYGRGRFIVDLISVLPFDFMVLAVMGKATQPQSAAPGISALALLRLVRMYRLQYFFDFLAVHPRVPYTLLVIIRNYTIVFYVVHFAGCMLYYIARLQNFSSVSWVVQKADRFENAGNIDRYLYSIYWAMTTLTSIGYGDLHPYSVPEVVFVIFFQAAIISICAFLTASITSLVIKTETFKGRYHEKLKNVLQYSRTHDLPKDLQQSLANHLRLHMANEAASDSTILSIYPSAVRRKVLRYLYHDDFANCYLFSGCPRPFLDKLVTQAYVEMYMPEVEIITRDEGVDHLYILVSGTAELTSAYPAELLARHSPAPAAIPDPHTLPAAAVAASARPDGVVLGDGSMFGELAFFLQNDSHDTVMTLTVCRVLAVSRRTYEGIKALYPGAARLVLQNLYDAANEVMEKQEAMGMPLAARSTVYAAVTPHGVQRENSAARSHVDHLSDQGSVPLSIADEGAPRDLRGDWKKQRQQLKQQLHDVGQLLRQHDQRLQQDCAAVSSTAASIAATSSVANPAADCPAYDHTQEAGHTQDHTS